VSWEVVDPPGLMPASGFSHGMLALESGRLLLVAGQAPTDSSGRVIAGDFVAQFAQALRNCVVVVRAAGGKPEHIGRFTIYVKDVGAYRARRQALGAVWRDVLGRHYPAVALLGVQDLVDEGAMVEIEATALIPGVAR
jgi:enamine deaminase RidA (YjgF/YER057c/UK114 family)